MTNEGAESLVEALNGGMIRMFLRASPPAGCPGRKAGKLGFGRLRACLKIQRGPTARLLALASVGSALIARCGDTRTSPPWPPPKSTAAGPLSIFRQALKHPLNHWPFNVLRVTDPRSGELGNRPSPRPAPLGRGRMVRWWSGRPGGAGDRMTAGKSLKAGTPGKG